MKWLAVAILLASLVAGTIYLSPTDQHVKKFYNNGQVVVLNLGSAWKVLHSPSGDYLGYAYWDLYIPEAIDHDVVLKITFSQSEYRAWIDVYCAPSESAYVWMNGVTTLQQYLALAGTQTVFSSRDMGAVNQKTVEIKIPKGNPWVRIMVLNNDIYNKGFYVELYKQVTYSVAEQPKLSVSITNINSAIAMALVLALAVALAVKKFA